MNPAGATPVGAACAFERVEFAALRRVLNVSIGRAHRNIAVAVYPSGKRRDHMIAYATGDLRVKGDVRLSITTDGESPPCLWIGRAAFDLTPNEVEPIRRLIAEFTDTTNTGTP